MCYSTILTEPNESVFQDAHGSVCSVYRAGKISLSLTKTSGQLIYLIISEPYE